MSTPRMRVLVAATLWVAGTSLLSTASASPGMAAATNNGLSVSATALAAPTGRTGLTTLGLGGWRVQSSAIATQTGSEISTPGFPTASWLAVTPDDAGAPGTEMEAALQNGACPNVFYSDNMKKCFGFQNGPGPVVVPKFAVPWWYRTDFTPDLRAGQNAKLIINGVVGQADVWVNGTQVASKTTVQGYVARFTFDITGLIRSGTNSLALEVHPNNSLKMLTIDFVDWTQVPLDDNTGIQFPIELQVSDALGISNAHIVQQNAPDLSSSALTVKADITNTTTTRQTGTVSATITPRLVAAAPSKSSSRCRSRPTHCRRSSSPRPDTAN